MAGKKSGQSKRSGAANLVKKQAKKKIIYAVLGWIGLPVVGLVALAVIIALVLGVGLIAGFGGGGGGSQASSLSQCMATASSDSSTDSGAPRVEISGGSLGDPLPAEHMNSSSGYGAREDPGNGSSWHDGLDLSAPLGTPIYSLADGEVVQAGPADGYGSWIRIKHDLDGEEFESLYGHMPAASITVSAGDKVKAGQKIAEVGSEGFSTGAHLHLGIYVPIWQQGQGVDPTPWLEKAKEHSSTIVDGGNDNTTEENDSEGESSSTATTPSEAPSDSSDNSDDGSADEPADNSGDEGASEDEEREAASTTSVETTRSGTLNQAQQANVAAIISAAKGSDLDDEEQQKRAAEIATAVAGMQSNFLSINNTDDPNRVGIFGLAPLGDLSREQLANPKRASEAFFDALTKEYTDDTRWMTMPTGDVVAEVYSSLTSVKDDVAGWDDMASGAVAQLWDTDEASADATPDAELTQNTSGDPCQPDGSSSGGALKPGSVPEEFVKWINLGAEMCEGVTPAIIAAQIYLESGFKPHEHNSAGASGYTQFIDSTWATYGYRVDDKGKPVGDPGGGDPNNVADAVMAQARLNCENVKTIQAWQEDGKVTKNEDMTRMMLAAYQGGPGSVLDAGGMPNRSDGNMTQTQYADHIIETSKQFEGTESENGTVNCGENSKAKEALRNVDLGSSCNEGRKIVEAAAAQVGITYAWGGGSKDGPTKGIHDGGVADSYGDFAKTGFDCSGLTLYAGFQATGKELPRTTGPQQASDQMKPVSMSDLKPGDFLYTPGHVSIYAGTNKDTGEQMIVEAPQSGQNVHVTTLNTPNAEARRLAD